MRQAIVTKYFGPTNSRGSRIKATCNAAFIYHEYEAELNEEQNHELAAATLLHKLGWGTKHTIRGGSLPKNKGYCFVLIEREENESSAKS